MSIKSFVAKILARKTSQRVAKESLNGIQHQQDWLRKLVSNARDTDFGKDHGFEDITSHEDFKKQVPIRDYEGLRPYVEKVLEGSRNVLWPGKPIYFAKTSGTTSGAKYIPITKDSISNHIGSARNMLLCYIHKKGNADFLSGKLIFLQGSPVLTKKNGINLGRLSGIVAHHVPGYRLPVPFVKCPCQDDLHDQDWQDNDQQRPGKQAFGQQVLDPTGEGRGYLHDRNSSLPIYRLGPQHIAFTTNGLQEYGLFRVIFQFSAQAGGSYEMAGQYGFSDTHAMNLPPFAQWGVPGVTGAWDEDAGESFGDVDFNVVSANGEDLVEVQGTAEGEPFSRAKLDELLDLAFIGLKRLKAIHEDALEKKS